MKRNTDKSRKIKCVVICITLFLMLAAIVTVVLLSPDGGIGSLMTIPTEATYIIFAALTLLPVLLVVMLIAALIDRKKSKKAEAEVVYLTDAASVAVVAPTSSATEGEEAVSGRAPRFCMLSAIDESRSKYDQKKFNEDISLKRFCDNFRNFAASEMKLYYEIDDIRRFIAGLAVSSIIILQGMSGTGKTSLAHAMGKFIENTSTVIPVQPMWKERTDLLGYYNEFTKRFNETLLLEKMYEANYSRDMYITVLDEMNIARVEYYFAEFLSLLELPPEERYVSVVSDVWDNDPVQLVGGRIKLPNNMWFIGTANNDDSTFAISDKVYDRAMILNLDTKAERFVAPRTKPVHMSAERFRELVEDAMREFELTKRNAKRLEELDKYLIDHFHITFGNRIMKQIQSYIPVYVSCGGEELEALDDILSKKIIRKLETQNPVYLRSSAEGLCNYLDELFGNDAMPLCKSAIHRLERNA